jgi:CHASE1-domain containing sensor protein
LAVWFAVLVAVGVAVLLTLWLAMLAYGYHTRAVRTAFDEGRLYQRCLDTRPAELCAPGRAVPSR